MKIVCGSCQAKYSIADEKVTGKVFKIRCKRCSEVIVVRGDQQDAAAPQATGAAAFDAGGDAIWHVVINGEQAGPYSPVQLGEMLSGGHLDWEAYVWCEGFDNWLPMRDVPDLVAAITGQGQEQAPAQPAAAYAAQPSMGADPFADDGDAGGMFAAPKAAPASRGASLFGGGGDSPFDGDSSSGQVVASSPRVSVEQAMTGARNENSVLFSLKNLQALATGSGSTSSPVSSAPGQARAGFAGGDGSGLIDIRALASATGVADHGREESEKDALLSLGSAQGGAFGSLGSPMLAPVAMDDGGSKKGLGIAVFGGLALLAVAVVAVAFIMRPQAPVQGPTVAAPTAAVPVTAAAAAVAPGAQPDAVEAPSEGELAAKRAAEGTGSEAEKRERERTGSTTRKRDDKPAAAEASPTRSEPVAAKVEEKAKPKGGTSSIDDLLDGAIGGSSKPAAAAKRAEPAADSNLPDKPSRDDVISAMNGVKGPVQACAQGQSGVAFANITVSGKTGRVSGAEVTGITGEAGSCIARAVRKASFPKFKSDTFQVKFPFRL
jgi:predicted Zn finger-like uncharacterized protein